MLHSVHSPCCVFNIPQSTPEVRHTKLKPFAFLSTQMIENSLSETILRVQQQDLYSEQVDPASASPPSAYDICVYFQYFPVTFLEFNCTTNH